MADTNRMTTAALTATGAETVDPLTPRSIVLSVLLGSHPPQMPVGRLLEFTSLFGLSNGTVRTALSRLVTAGDLANDDGTYRLTGRLLERQAQQDASRRPPPIDWDHTWWTVAVLSERRTIAERRAFRAAATGACFGELRPDLWLRPANVALASSTFATHSAMVVTRGPIVIGDPHELARHLWDLDALATHANSHLRELGRCAEQLARPGDRALADSFAVLAAAQRFLRVEPQLPAALAPSPTGAALRSRYLEVVDVFQTRLAEFFGRRRVGVAKQISTAGR